jgi:hypothetical protein
MLVAYVQALALVELAEKRPTTRGKVLIPALGEPHGSTLGGILFQVLLFSSYGVHAVPGTLSQMDCNIVSVTEQIRYVLITSHPSTLPSNSLYTGSLDELGLGI